MVPKCLICGWDLENWNLTFKSILGLWLISEPDISAWTFHHRNISARGHFVSILWTFRQGDYLASELFPTRTCTGTFRHRDILMPKVPCAKKSMETECPCAVKCPCRNVSCRNVRCQNKPKPILAPQSHFNFIQPNHDIILNNFNFSWSYYGFCLDLKGLSGIWYLDRIVGCNGAHHYICAWSSVSLYDYGPCQEIQIVQ